MLPHGSKEYISISPTLTPLTIFFRRIQRHLEGCAACTPGPSTVPFVHSICKTSQKAGESTALPAVTTGRCLLHVDVSSYDYTLTLESHCFELSLLRYCLHVDVSSYGYALTLEPHWFEVSLLRCCLPRTLALFCWFSVSLFIKFGGR